MNYKNIIVPSVLALGIGACASNGPVDPNRGEIISTPGVRAVFEDSDVDVAEAKEEVRCERITKTGTHRVFRYCYTVAEEDDRNQRNDNHIYNHWSRGACNGSRGSGNCDSEGKRTGPF